MKVRPLNTCLVCLYFFIYSSALPRSKDYRQSSEYVPGETTMALDTLSKEPTCEELRAMWRFSKRQSRASEITNEIPMYRDPFIFNVWEEYARPRSAGPPGRRLRRPPPVYGTLIPSPHHPSAMQAFEEMIRMYGSSASSLRRNKSNVRLAGAGALAPRVITSPAQIGSFQHLKELIRNERARELQEQRMGDDPKGFGKIKYGRTSPNSPSAIDNMLIQNEPPAIQGKGVVAFPDILVPAAYMEDYAFPSQNAMYKYKQQYPDNFIMDKDSQWSW